jgi:hydrogenase expression/formation protein HypC
MCLAIPMEIKSIGADSSALAVADGIERAVSLMLIENPEIGDFVIVHAGFAIEKLDRAEAEERLKLFAELARVSA